MANENESDKPTTRVDDLEEGKEVSEADLAKVAGGMRKGGGSPGTTSPDEVTPGPNGGDQG